MARYLVNMRVDYSFDIEADTPEEAEALAWEYDYQEDRAAYDGVYSIEVDPYLDDEEEEED
jgi:hypothetical protein